MEKEKSENANEVINLLNNLCSVEDTYGISLKGLAELRIGRISKE
jgi:hypothetical protein